MRRQGGAAVFAILLGLYLALPSHVLAEQLPTFASPEQALARLRSEKAPSPTANLLRVGSCGGSSADDVCADVKMQLRRPRLVAGTETAVIEIRGTQRGDVVVLARDKSGKWVLVDTLNVTCPYEPMQVEFKSVVAQPVEEILIHNNAEFWGHAYLGHFLIVKVIDGRLQVVFSAMEKAYAHMASPTFDASSTFQLTPGSVIQTARYDNEGSPSFTVTRSFDWNETLRVFLPGLRDEIRR
jgi:hypothetical protein